MPNDDDWRVALEAAYNLVSSRMGRHKDDPDVKDVVATAAWEFLKYYPDDSPVENLALLFFICNKVRVSRRDQKGKLEGEIPVGFMDSWIHNMDTADVTVPIDCESLKEKIPDDLNKVIWDLYTKGFSYETIGDVLGFHKSTISRRLQVMKDAMQGDLE